MAFIGANGAGKFTAIKVLVCEQLPTSGSFWKAAGFRFAYVAQHAFLHLEVHRQESPTRYIMWRFAGNDDKENIEFKSVELAVDEESARSVRCCIDGMTGNVRPYTDPKSDAKKAKADVSGAVVPEATMNRRQKKKEKTFEYEVKWQFKPIEANVWVDKAILFELDYKKLVEREVECQAAMVGFHTKFFTQPGVEKQPGDCGVER